MGKLIMTIFVASVVIGGHLPIAAAQETEKKGRGEMGMHGMGMDAMDRNEDGKISKEEFMQAHEDMFAQMDQDNDGLLNRRDMDMGMMDRCRMMKHMME